MDDVDGRARQAVRAVAALAVLVLLAGCQLVERSTGQRVTKVVVVGDSVMNWETSYLRTKFAPYGVDVQYVGALSSGPLSFQKRWATDLRAKLATYPADIVIFESCCHYEGRVEGQLGPLYVNADGVAVQPDTELMYQEIRTAELELVEIARDAGASPYWVKLPPGNVNTTYYGPTFPTRINRYNQIAETLGVPIIDWGAAVQSQPNVNQLRYPDGVHFYEAGYEFLATYTFNATVKYV
jgi:hypothetical protein